MREAQPSEAAVLRIADSMMADETFLIEKDERNCGVGSFGDAIELRASDDAAVVLHVVSRGAVFFADDGFHRRDGEDEAFALGSGGGWCGLEEAADALPFFIAIAQL